ncbi:tetratricopeptide repeat protein, partial [Streptomyces sp. JAC25]|uniref:tetratricopeptide repeat protein n=1 Tax=Streptomyces sp. JAC25 TaxID=3418413 RepID=UPI003D81558A
PHNTHANTRQGLGGHQQAAARHRQNISAYERTLGPEHSSTLTSRHNLAIGLSDMGEHQQAADLHRQNLTDGERTLGD